MPTPIKHPKLKDINWVAKQLKYKSPAELAKEIGCYPSSVLWVIDRYLQKEKDEGLIKYTRKPHKNKKKID